MSRDATLSSNTDVVGNSLYFFDFFFFLVYGCWCAGILVCVRVVGCLFCVGAGVVFTCRRCRRVWVCCVAFDFVFFLFVDVCVLPALRLSSSGNVVVLVASGIAAFVVVVVVVVAVYRVAAVVDEGQR